jgi:hypothetical protein
MDPITSTVAAATACLAAGTEAVPADKAVREAYAALKAIVRRRYGDESNLHGAMERLERQPKSARRRKSFAEEVMAAKAAQNPELLAAAQRLLATLPEVDQGRSPTSAPGAAIPPAAADPTKGP